MSMANNERGPDGLRAVERTVGVLQALAATPAGASLTELVKATGIPTTTLHRMLSVLRGSALVRETADGRYALAAGTMTLSRAYLDGIDLRQEALQVMRPLSARTGETIHLGVLALSQVVYIEKVESPAPVRMYSRVGDTNSALTTALGRAILAASPAPVDSPAFLAPELDERVRAAGYATDLQENEIGICCVAAPVLDHTGRVTAGLSISVPASRFDSAALGPQVVAAAEDLSRRLGWTGPAVPRQVTRSTGR
jgi:IclR family acetate operon transcriptional repressor